MWANHVWSPQTALFGCDQPETDIAEAILRCKFGRPVRPPGVLAEQGIVLTEGRRYQQLEVRHASVIVGEARHEKQRTMREE